MSQVKANAVQKRENLYQEISSFPREQRLVIACGVGDVGVGSKVSGLSVAHLSPFKEN